jgi:chromosome segregation and condensation protein ScpB
MEEHLATLAACLVASRGTTLAALARALDMSIPAVREGLLRIADHLAAAGVRAVEDGAEVGLVPLPFAAPAVAAVTPLEPVGELSDEQAAVLCVVAYHGAATRRDVERLRGEDSETLLRRLVERGLLHKAADEASLGGPNVYRVTTKALAATGHTTLESLQAYLTAYSGESEHPARSNPNSRFGVCDHPRACRAGAAATRSGRPLLLTSS